jgi:hypothetical protein
MLSKINLACVGALTLLPHLAIAADATLPKANVESMCQAEQSAAPPGSKASDFQSCVNDERKALTELRRNWARYPIKARATCAAPKGISISYVELQTCLEMQQGGSFDATNSRRRKASRVVLSRLTNAGASRETGNSAGSMPRDGTVARP